MKRISILIVAILLFFNVTYVSAEAPVSQAVTNGCNTIDGAIPVLGINQLVSNTAAAILYEVSTDTVMYAYNADNQVQPSSLLKIITALIAIEKGNMDSRVTVHAHVLDSIPHDAAMVGLIEEEIVTVRDLVYCMMVGSGNDAAVVLADHIMGSQDAFVEEMNRYATQLGCKNTHFTNVHGLYDEAQYTTARDVAKIIKAAMANEIFRQVFSAKYYEMPETNRSEARKLATQNYLINNEKLMIYHDERVTGGRTGINNDRTRSIASTAQANGMEMICVVIGARSQFEEDGYTEKVFGGYTETTQLLDLAFNGYKPAQILYAEQILQQSSVLNGSCDVSLGIKEGLQTIIPANLDVNTLTFRYVDQVNLAAPIEKGQKLSSLQVWNGSVCLAQTDVFAMNRVPIAGTEFDNEVQNSGQKAGKTFIIVAGIILGVLIVTVSVLLVLRRVRITRIKMQSKRYKRSRRRSR